ncbi:MAG: AglZ/HisF2 family acetamidino modification protein [Pyrinomonadaceae bacterium]
MSRPRIIPVLLLRDGGLVKSVKFRSHKYIGDPLNAARIFNELEADELIFLDIDASRNGRSISLDFVNAVAEEVSMPFSVGGGITSIEEIRAITRSGVEKVIIGSHAVQDPEFVRQAADAFGSSTISVCIDVKKDLFRGERVRTVNGRIRSHFEPIEFARLMETHGAGELIVQSIDRDGTMSGYDIGLVKAVSDAVDVPVVALGGASGESDLVEASREGCANGVAAGSLFIYQSAARGVLINYPEDKGFLYDIA